MIQEQEDDTTDLITLARHCSCLRKEGDAEAVIEITQEVIDSMKSRSNEAGFDRILCTRGAAHRQLRKYSLALSEAQQAIEINATRHHPFNLAGAACFAMLRYDEGLEYFNKARKLAANEAAEKRFARMEAIKLRAELRAERQAALRIKQKESKRQFKELIAKEHSEATNDEQRERLESERFIAEELSDFADSIELSSEDGWFYQD